MCLNFFPFLSWKQQNWTFTWPHRGLCIHNFHFVLMKTKCSISSPLMSETTACPINSFRPLVICGSHGNRHIKPLGRWWKEKCACTKMLHYDKLPTLLIKTNMDMLIKSKSNTCNTLPTALPLSRISSQPICCFTAAVLTKAARPLLSAFLHFSQRLH